MEFQGKWAKISKNWGGSCSPCHPPSDAPVSTLWNRAPSTKTSAPVYDFVRKLDDNTSKHSIYRRVLIVEESPQICVVYKNWSEKNKLDIYSGVIHRCRRSQIMFELNHRGISRKINWISFGSILFEFMRNKTVDVQPGNWRNDSVLSKSISGKLSDIESKSNI